MNDKDLRISARARNSLDYQTPLFNTDDDLKLIHSQAAELAMLYNRQNPDKVQLSAAKLNASGILHMMYQAIITRYLQRYNNEIFTRMCPLVKRNRNCATTLKFFADEFPSPALNSENPGENTFLEETIRGFFVHNVLVNNPAIMNAAKELIAPAEVVFPKVTNALNELLEGFLTFSGKDDGNLFDFLTKPAKLYPDSLEKQIRYALEHWGQLLPEFFRLALLRALDYLKEEDHPSFAPGKANYSQVPSYSDLGEYEAFSSDRNWMPNVVMMAKSTLVWLDQLSKKYSRSITRLDEIPDEELDSLRERGFTALWLIGLWERSNASKTIKNLCGNPEAEASAYSLRCYDISESLGGWSALENLRARCEQRGIRLASDMVPNHTGIDSDWISSHPEYFISQDYPPFPSYTFNGPDLSIDPSVEIKIDDHYYNRTDAAVTFRRIDRRSGETRYIFHGNDGTSMPWNDTAQIDFLNKDAREAVIQQIIHVAKNFRIIRFDAAMTLAKRHIRRLWYPAPGQGGDIAGRADHSISDEEFNRLIPVEFWREVVDRMTAELPDTLLLAEAFWMLEGYFVRTLGMHRVYNSAFMHMLKNEDNSKYRASIKETILFDPEILKRYVNFMNNPDEETAIAQFGDSDKYFGVCTILSTLPGLPMFGHGQIEGFREKYGMEYRKAYWDEKENTGLVNEHYRRIFPLLKDRYLFSGVDKFQFFDVRNEFGTEESVFAYSNGVDGNMTLVFYNNRYQAAGGTIHQSAPKLIRKDDGSRAVETTSIAESLGLSLGGKRYMIWQTFPDNLWHVVPSLRIFDEGITCSLSGYEAKVMLHIHEITDADGSIQRLYEKIGTSGVADIEDELRAVRLEPVFQAMAPLKSEDAYSAINAIISGKSNARVQRKLAVIAGEAYARLEIMYERLSKAEKSVLPRIHEVNPSALLRALQRLSDCCASSAFFSNACGSMEELGSLLLTGLFIRPFIRENFRFENVLYTYRILMPERFFGTPESLILSSLILSGYLMNGDIQAITSDETIRSLCRINEYQGVTWYNKEALQEVIFTCAVSEVMFASSGSLGKDELAAIEARYGKILESELRSGYRLNNLIALVQKED